MLLPEYSRIVYSVATPIILGEVVFALWLLIIGAKQKPPAADVA
jgi:hypothetical protein